MANSQVEIQTLTKCCNEALILASLRDGPKHGYQLALDLEARSEGRFKFNHGTLYPILHKLEKEDLISGTWSDQDVGRKRKSYALTDQGRSYADEQRVSWQAFIARFLDVVGGEQQ